MSTIKNYLINNSKYSFLKKLGLEERNAGVFDGTWKGSGSVRFNFKLDLQKLTPIETLYKNYCH